MKKILSLILIICLGITLVSCGSKQTADVPDAKPVIDVVAQYRDVNEGDWYTEAVDWGVNENIMTSAKPDLFGAATPITKAQVIISMWKAAGSPGQVVSPKSLPDSDPNSDFSKAMEWAVDENILDQIDKFANSKTLTRLEAIGYLWSEANKPVVSGINFEDTEGEDSVLWAKANKIAYGIGHNLFGPEMDCTKAHMITFLFRAK